MNKIKYYRDKKNVTQKDLATELGITQQMVSRYEKGIATPSVKTAQKIAMFLDAEINDVFLPINTIDN